MSHHPQDGSADDALSKSLLRFIEDGQLPELRQALSGFNHRCRNMLNSMKMGFYLARRAATGPLPERWDELNRTYLEVERIFDLLQAIYRTMSLTLVQGPFRAVVEERGREWRGAFERESASLAIRPPSHEAAGEFDAMRLSSALDGFIAWRASRVGPGGRATLSWATTRRHFELQWTETASPVAATRASAPLCPIAALAVTGRSLALPLLARVVAEHRGRLTWSPGNPAELRIRWPLIVSVAAPPGPFAGHHPVVLAPSLG